MLRTYSSFPFLVAHPRLQIGLSDVETLFLVCSLEITQLCHNMIRYYAIHFLGCVGIFQLCAQIHIVAYCLSQWRGEIYAKLTHRRRSKNVARLFSQVPLS